MDEEILGKESYNTRLELVKKAFLHWKSIVEAPPTCLQIEQIELPFISDTYGYGGTIDAVAKFNLNGESKVMIIDWKTSNSFHKEYALQVAAYAKAYEDIYNTPVFAGLVVRFDKNNPVFEAKRIDREQIPEAFSFFMSLLNLYPWASDGVNLWSK
eukprot:TRINITY_DN9581_c0_g1_i1.p1 TRINITY_DN9581_c0_g1~~TRINITY_DN9581_c0_g1_i1.p1  ORF type:complete len:167 (-),score=37.04 TRINITY_DN9581_c0_g1_i1:107-574(-)